MRAWFDQAKATTDGRRGLVVLLSYLILMPATLAVSVTGLLIGAKTLSSISAVFTFGLGVITVPVTAIAQGYNRAPDALSSSTGVWHLTSQLWDVGDALGKFLAATPTKAQHVALAVVVGAWRAR